jgi:hypothetical protein
MSAPARRKKEKNVENNGEKPEEYTYMVEYMYSLYDGSEQTGT